MSFREALELARGVRKRFEEIEGQPWGAEGALLELSKQVGELSRMVLAYENYYFPDRGKVDKRYKVSKEEIADELADILYSIIRIADHYSIDLEGAHRTARKKEDEFLKSRGL